MENLGHQNPTESHGSATWWPEQSHLWISPSQSQLFVHHHLFEGMESGGRTMHSLTGTKSPLSFDWYPLSLVPKTVSCDSVCSSSIAFLRVCTSSQQPWKTMAPFYLQDLVSKTFSLHWTTLHSVWLEIVPFVQTSVLYFLFLFFFVFNYFLI